MRGISKINADRFYRDVNSILDLYKFKDDWSANIIPISKEATIPRQCKLSVCVHDEVGSPFYSVFCRFENPSYAAKYGGSSISGKCNIHQFEASDAIRGLKEFLEMVFKYSEDITPIDPT